MRGRPKAQRRTHRGSDYSHGRQRPSLSGSWRCVTAAALPKRSTASQCRTRRQPACPHARIPHVPPETARTSHGMDLCALYAHAAARRCTSGYRGSSAAPYGHAHEAPPAPRSHHGAFRVAVRPGGPCHAFYTCWEDTETTCDTHLYSSSTLPPLTFITTAPMAGKSSSSSSTTGGAGSGSAGAAGAITPQAMAMRLGTVRLWEEVRKVVGGWRLVHCFVMTNRNKRLGVARKATLYVVW